MIGAMSRRIAVWMPRELDRSLCGAAGALLLLGLVMVASASVAVGEKLTGSPLYFFYRQLIYAGVGLAAGACAFMVPMKAWQRSSFALLALALVLLVVVLLPGVGREVNSARRWIDLQFFSLQASEPARLAIIMYLAGYIVRRQVELQHTFTGLVKPLLPIGLACLLLLLEPDYGAAAILMGVVFLMLFLGGARLLYLGAFAAVAAVGFAWLALAQPYRLRRLMGFSDPWADIEHSGWQLAQSLIAIGRGEWTGVGLGNSVQKLLYLPEQHTDFIYAIFAEEFGLVGTLVLITLFAVLVWRGFAIGQAAEQLDQRFRAYVAYGISGWLGTQTLINLAVNMGLVPTKGLTLPLMSYGGSSLVTVCIMLALLLRVDHENRQAAAGRPASKVPR
jgi:cell division protein FtsW